VVCESGAGAGTVGGNGCRCAAEALSFATRAHQQRCEQAATLRKQFNVVLEKTARELRGTACLELGGVAPPKQEPIREAVATYAARACEKLRKQGTVCKRVRVSIRTGMFDPDEPKFARGVLCELAHPSDDTRLITQAVLAGLEQIYRPGYSFAKAQVLLLDLYQRGEFTDDLFAAAPPAAAEKVMAVPDAVNAKWGRGTLRPGIVPVNPSWMMKQGMLSRCYTTRIDHLWRVAAR
jgi:DNA polymerase V